MLKGVGMILILAAGTGIGFEKSRALVKRKETLELLLYFVILLNGEIRCGNFSLSEALCEMSGKFYGEFREIMCKVVYQMQEAKGERFGEIFLRNLTAFLKKNHLSCEEQACMENLGRQLGYLDQKMQLRQLELCEKELERLLANLRLVMPEKQKLYRSLGILGSILLSIFLW